MTYKIEKGIEFKDEPRGTKYPFAQMEIGDSILIPNGDSLSSKVRSASFNYGIKHNKKFAVRKNSDGLRVWRVE